jgi:hypothetical protein
MPTFLVRAGRVAGDDVFVRGDLVAVLRDGELIRRHVVPDYGTGLGELAARDGFALGWGRFPDDAEVLSLDDKGDNGFGYALNLSDPGLSEWGYAPF